MWCASTARAPDVATPPPVTADLARFAALVAAVGLTRLAELARAGRNRRRLLAKGGIEVGAGHWPAMVAVHAGVLFAAPLEVWLARRPLYPVLAGTMLVVLAITFAARYWVITILGDRWTTRIVVVPGASRITRGPYRWVRHPNYLAVAFEVPALPLVHTAWITALVFGLANLAVLAVRIRAEDEALMRLGSEEPRIKREE